MRIVDHTQANQSFLFLPDLTWNADSLYTFILARTWPVDGRGCKRGYHDGYLPSYLQVEQVPKLM